MAIPAVVMLSALLAAAYLAQLFAKLGAAQRYAVRVRALDGGAALATTRISVLQPILSGDPELGSALQANLTGLPYAAFLWLVDEDDHAAQRITDDLMVRYPGRIERVICPPPPQGVNPKAHKLALAIGRVGTEVFVVLDDDTRLGEDALNALRRGLETGATLATGLPRYREASGRCSGWLAEFVNSSAVLTYLPALAFSPPLTIHGMCYAMRTADARRLDVFNAIKRCLTDDLALALELRRRNLRLFQTVASHDIATSVVSFEALAAILNRWFVFARLLVAECPVLVRLALAVAFVLPPLLLAGLGVTAFVSLQAAVLLAITLLVREVVLRGVKRRFLGGGLSHRLIPSLLLELAQPVLLLRACLTQTIRWRTRRIRIRSVAVFEYV